jgi:hypothetical protein
MRLQEFEGLAITVDKSLQDLLAADFLRTMPLRPSPPELRAAQPRPLFTFLFFTSLPPPCDIAWAWAK